MSKYHFVCKNCGEVKNLTADTISKTEDGADVDYIATVSFDGQTYTGKYIHDNANADDPSSVIGSAFGNGSVFVLIIILVLAVIITVVFIILKKKKMIKDDDIDDSKE